MQPDPETAKTGTPPETDGTLHLSVIGGAFDPVRDIAVGPHCFMDRDIMDDWTALDFIDPFPEESDLEKAQRQVAALVNVTIPGLAERLNARHGTTYSIDFWRVLTLTWLAELAQRAWSGYVTLQKAVTQYGGRSLTVKVCRPDRSWQFSDTAAFYKRLVYDDGFNWWIDSQILAVLAPTAWRIEQSAGDDDLTDDRLPQNPSPVSKRFTGRMVRRLKYWLGYTDVIGAKVSGLLLAVYANLLPKRPARARFTPDPDYRPEAYFPADFLSLFNRLVETTMPDSMAGDFSRLERQAKSVFYRPGRLRIGTIDLWNDAEKMYAAFAKEAGEKLVVCQHGGLYGISKYNMLTNEFEYPTNIFFSWGWTTAAETGGHIVPLPSPYTSKVADRHRRSNDDIIFVGAASFFLQKRIFWHPRGAKYLRYVSITLDFLKALNPDARKDVIIRPYPHAGVNVDFGDIARRKYPDMPTLTGSLHGAVLKCRLAVLLGYSTTLNITMAANTPTVIIWQRDFLPPREEAQPYFDDLEACGVLYFDAEAAARHINTIAEDVDGWWARPDVQRARKRWRDRFARTDRFWWWRWMQALARLKNVG